MNGAPLARSVTSPLQQTQGTVVPVRLLQLTDIPQAMDKMGWTVAAQLMRHWFSIRPAWEMSGEIKKGDADPLTLQPNQFNTRIVKLDWVLGFPRVRAVLKDLMDNWHTPAGIDQLVIKLKRAHWDSTKSTSVGIGYGAQNAVSLDAQAQVNTRPVGSKLDVLDGLYGALGKANLKLAVAGRTHYHRLTGFTEFRTEKVGLYVRDTYDFNSTIFEESVPLGIWNRNRCLDKAETAAYLALTPLQRGHVFPGFVPVYNRDFRRWQQLHNAGGDFVVYSDIQWFRGHFEPIPLP